MRYILAHDLGTTGDKATLYDETGTLCASAFVAYPTTYPAPGWAEQNPLHWWSALCESTQQLLARRAVAREIACVSFSGQMQGLVAVDRQGLPLRNAAIWADHRAAALLEDIDPALVYALSGHRLSASYTAAKIRWLQRTEPQVACETAMYVQAKDAMVARLTGVFATDPSDASGTNLYDIRRGEWSEELLAAFDIPRRQLPPVMPSTTVVGEVHEEAARATGLCAGTPVVLGGGDGSCAATGAGAICDGDAYAYIGSSSWIMVAADRPIYDPGRRTVTWPHLIPGLYVAGGAMQTGGAAYQWARDHLAADLRAQEGDDVYALMNSEAAQAAPGAGGLLFLPYLLGERCPHWNPEASAAFVGLTMRHRRADMLRAVLEGVAFNLRTILEVIRNQGGAVTTLRVIGGGARSALWSRILADVLQVAVQRLNIMEEATSMGAAVVGGVGSGVWKDFAQVHGMAHIESVVTPDARHATMYDRQHALFSSLYQVLERAGIFHELAAFEPDRT